MKLADLRSGNLLIVVNPETQCITLASSEALYYTAIGAVKCGTLPESAFVSTLTNYAHRKYHDFTLVSMEEMLS